MTVRGWETSFSEHGAVHRCRIWKEHVIQYAEGVSDCSERLVLLAGLIIAKAKEARSQSVGIDLTRPTRLASTCD